MPPDHARETLAGHHAQPGAHHLHRGHQGKVREHRPKLCIPEGGAGHRVSRDPRRIVVGGSGDQPRSQTANELAAAYRKGKASSFRIQEVRVSIGSGRPHLQHDRGHSFN